MSDLKFLSARIDRDVFASLDAAYKHDAVTKAALAFKQNVGRVQSAYQLITEIIVRSTSVGMVLMGAHFERQLIKPLKPDAETNDDITDERKLRETFNEVLNVFAENEHDTTSLCKNIFNLYDHPLSPDGQNSVLSSMIVGAWTACEVLAEDLWERILNEHPHHLSQVKFPSHDDKKGMDVVSVQKAGFDLRNKMGTILKDRFAFHKLSGMHFAYKAAFRDGHAQVVKAATDWNLAALFHLRNLIAHNGGVIDEKFMEETASVAPLKDIRALGIGTPVIFDGEMVSKFVSEGVKCGCALLTAVDDWLESHPSPK